MEYQLYKDLQGNLVGVQRFLDNTFIPANPDNTDYQAFLKYQAEGGVVLPADDNG